MILPRFRATAFRSMKYILLGLFIASFLALVELPVKLNNWQAPMNPNNLQSIVALPMGQFIPLYLVFVTSGGMAGVLLRNRGMKVMVLCGIATVMLVFWGLHSPLGYRESASKLVNVAVIERFGKLDQSLMTYYEFPGLFIDGYSFSATSGLGLIQFQSIYTILLSWLLSLSVYVLSLKLLRDANYAFLAVLAFLEGNIYLTPFYYHPDLLSVFVVPLTAAFLLGRKGGTPVMLLLFGFAAITDLSAAIVLLTTVLFLYAASRVHHSQPRIPVRMIIAGVLLMVGWMIFWGGALSGFLLSQMLTFMRDPGAGLLKIGNAYSSNVIVPFWSILTRFLWIGLLIGVPILVLLAEVAQRRFSAPTLWSILLAPAIVAIAATVGAGGLNFFVVLIYAPIAGAILLIRMLGRHRLGFLLVLVLVISLAVPSFLTYGNRVIEFSTPYQYYSSASFVSTNSAPSQAVFTADFAVLYHNPLLNMIPNPDLSVIAPGANQSEVAEGLAASYVLQFLNERGAIFFVQPFYYDNYYHLFGVATGKLVESQTGTHLIPSDLVYSDGYSNVYVSQT